MDFILFLHKKSFGIKRCPPGTVGGERMPPTDRLQKM
jgi:hypothetical protein